MTSLPASSPPPPSKGWGGSLPAILQGALMGLVELVPGVSGGTIALVLGIYDRLIHSANHVVRAATSLLGRRSRTLATAHLKQVEWALVLPLLVGMGAALLMLAGPLHHFVETQPVVSRALFLGMVLASLLVPTTMVQRLTPPGRAPSLRNACVVLAVAAAVFLLLGLPAMQVEEPTWWVLLISGAVAICALVLPGLSGSFVLLTVGMYEPTLEAVSNRDLGYIALFGAGTVVGLATLVRALAYLLREHRRPTLLVATGLILGSLRAIWPWQEGTALLAPDPNDWLWPTVAAVAGAVSVALLWLRENRDSQPS